MAQVTALTIYGVSGRTQSFSPKGVGPHPVDWITALTAYGVSGRTQSFTAKTAVEAIITGAGGRYVKRRKRIDWRTEEEEIMAVITAFLHTRRH